MSLDSAEQYLADRIAELKRMVPDGTPWVFLCGCSLIECLARLAAGKDDGEAGFVHFVETYMPAAYREHRFESGETDLPTQVYRVLWLGLAHNFSFAGTTGRDRSMAMSHADPHFSTAQVGKVKGACVLNAEGFVGDIESAVRSLFAAARGDSALASNITGRLERHRFISEDASHCTPAETPAP